MEFVVWGVGARGKNLYKKFSDNIVAFIDSDKKKVGMEWCGKKIIDLEYYKMHYTNYVILISMIRADWTGEIVRQLKEEGIEQFFLLSECPAEMLLSLEHYELWKQYIADRRDEKDRNYGIFGASFYTIFLYDYMYSLGWKNLYLIFPENADPARKQKIIELLPFIKEYDTSHHIQLHKVFKAVRDKDAKLRNIECTVEVEEFYNFAFKICEYDKIDLKQYAKIHRGKRCFIVATGPSLTVDDVNKINRYNEYAIGMNKLYLIFENTEWRPQYWVGTDRRVVSESWNEIVNMDVENKFISDYYFVSDNGQLSNGIHLLHISSDVQTDCLPYFSSDISKVAYDCGTVTYICLQLAMYLGFQEIILLGVDFSIVGDYMDKRNHFTDKYYGANATAGPFLKEAQLMGYQRAKIYAEQHGVKIYNATRGGELEVFPRIDFDSLF